MSSPISFSRRGDEWYTTGPAGGYLGDFPRLGGRGCYAVTYPDDEFHPYNRHIEVGFLSQGLRSAVRLVLE